MFARLLPAAKGVVRLPAMVPARLWGLRLLWGGWLTLQVLMPLRHHAYPGNVSWTEEGHLFAWHMKLRSKQARASFTLTDTQTGETRSIPAREMLTERQHRKMITRPELMRQFAHHVEALYIEETGQDPANVTVTVRASAALNGRRMQPFIVRGVDLTEEESLIWPPADWIIPLKMPLRYPGE